jgi:hypothetical protein
VAADHFMSSDEYRTEFGLPTATGTDNQKLLNLALEIRRFEIDLYWKRATYFWAFLAITLGGYFTAFRATFLQRSEKGETLLTISCLGLVFSVAWYFVNRASKFWQENWEHHVDLLENGVVGPLYKTVVLDAKLSFWRLNGPYPFSVSKINQLLSLFVAALFLMLVVRTLHGYFWLWWPPFSSTLMVVLTAAAVAALCLWGRTSLDWKRPEHPTDGTSAKAVYAVRRTTKIV